MIKQMSAAQDIDSYNGGKYLIVFLFVIDILKSVYELRKSHAAIVNRPISSQPFNQRRNIQSAVARQPQQMAFGGFMIPNENFVDEQQILEIEEFPAKRGDKKNKVKKPPKTTTNQSRSGTSTVHPQHHHMQIALKNPGMIHVNSQGQFNTVSRSPGNARNVGTALTDDIDIKPLMVGSFNNSQPSGLRLSQTQTEKFNIPQPKSTKSKQSNDRSGQGIKKLIKIASSRDGI